jgi:hypothetical protein
MELCKIDPWADTSLFMSVRFLSEPNFSYQIIPDNEATVTSDPVAQKIFYVPDRVNKIPTFRLYVTVPNPNVPNANVPNVTVPNFNMPNYNVPKCQGVDVIKCRMTNVPHYNGPNQQIVEFSN